MPKVCLFSGENFVAIQAHSQKLFSMDCERREKILLTHVENLTWSGGKIAKVTSKWILDNFRIKNFSLLISREVVKFKFLWYLRSSLNFSIKINLLANGWFGKAYAVAEKNNAFHHWSVYEWITLQVGVSPKEGFAFHSITQRSREVLAWLS